MKTLRDFNPNTRYNNNNKALILDIRDFNFKFFALTPNMTRQAKAEMIPCDTRSAKIDRQKYIKITSIASSSQQLA